MKRICPECGKIVDSDHICPNRLKDTRKKNIHNYKWNQIARQVKQRDMCCLVCWDHGVLTTKNLEAHHIKWREVDDSEENLYNPDGIITVCQKCHHAIHREPMRNNYRYLLDLIKKYCNYRGDKYDY